MAKGENKRVKLGQLNTISKPRRGRPANLSDAEMQYEFVPTFTIPNPELHASDASKRSVQRVNFHAGKSLENILRSGTAYAKGLIYRTADFHYDVKHGYLKNVHGAPSADGNTTKGAKPKSAPKGRSSEMAKEKTPDLKTRARMFASSRPERATQHTACKVPKDTELSVGKASVGDEQNGSTSKDLKEKDLQIETLKNNCKILLAQVQMDRVGATAKISALEQKIKLYKVSTYICITHMH